MNTRGDQNVAYSHNTANQYTSIDDQSVNHDACKPPPPGGGSVLTPRAAKPPLLRGGCSPFYQPPLSFLRRQESILLLTVDSFPHLPIYPSTPQPETCNLQPETCFYYTHDHLYSTVALIDDQGNVLERYEYNAYGMPTIYNSDFSQTYNSSQYGNPYLFTCRRVDNFDSDSLRLQYNRNRYLDYYTGRWLSHDPEGYVDGMNLYEYVKSKPTIGLDKYGKFFVCAGWGAGATVGTGIGIPGWVGGLSISFAHYICGGKSKKFGWTCRKCSVMSVTYMPSVVGAYAGVGTGPSFIINPFTDRGLPDESGRWGIAVGAGGAANIPPLAMVVKEITVDVDVRTGDVTINLPRFSIGYGFYFGARLTGSCTACNPNKLAKLKQCLRRIIEVLFGASNQVINNPIKLQEITTIRYIVNPPPDPGDLDPSEIP